mmetsp:Transcript_128558/g.181362  ORF Transcript_128558/g.181362 Transcript_128558/m.181362 type:complete len:203 (-) Transcript_128558:296-904(-)
MGLLQMVVASQALGSQKHQQIGSRNVLIATTSSGRTMACRPWSGATSAMSLRCCRQRHARPMERFLMGTSRVHPDSMGRTPTAVLSQIPCAMLCRRGTMRSRILAMISKALVPNLVCITSHKWCGRARPRSAWRSPKTAASWWPTTSQVATSPMKGTTKRTSRLPRPICGPSSWRLRSLRANPSHRWWTPISTQLQNARSQR